MTMEADTRLGLLTQLLLFALSWQLTLGSDGSAPEWSSILLRDRQVYVNDSTKLLCRYKGAPKPFIEWYANGERLGPSKRFKIAKYSLNLKDIKPKDAGSYACKVWNRFGILWGNFTLKVLNNTESPTPPDYYIEVPEDIFEDLKSKPAFSRKKDYSDYVSGSATKSVTLDCDAIGYPDANITWYRTTKLSNGIPEPNVPYKPNMRQTGLQPINYSNSKYKKEGWKLTIEDIALEDKGNYTCIVANELGSINWNFTVEVLQRLPIAPIVAALENQTAVVGEDVMWTCQIGLTDSQPMLQWLQHYQVNNSWTNEKGQPHVKLLQTVDDPQLLELKNVSVNDAGWYTCLAANSVGMNYRSAYLTVLTGSDGSAPEWSSILLRDRQVYVNDSTKLLCRYKGAPKPFIEWYANGERLGPSKRFKIAKYSLNLKDIKPKDAGSYACRVWNEFGILWGNFTLKVLNNTESPTPPDYYIEVPEDIFEDLKIAYADQPDDKFSYESKLLEKVIRMEIKMSQLEQVLVQTGNKFENLLMNVTVTLENKTAELDVLKDHIDLPLVAFHAYYPVDSSLDTNQILILSNVTMNEGDGYDNVIGTFRAPVAGLYYFAAHVCNYATRGFYYEIVKDHAMIAKSVKYNNAANDCGSVNVITKMEKDERVWIRCTSGNTSPQLYSSTSFSASYGKTSFLGILMHK
ncbi:hemicentin-2-like isoform X2 [Mya arenaria]|uniref:hemicentin-2-like isoform X2 n=1 Tax=Mya arenaria TaxID=6604 RepID=UPI0022E0F0A5|nr:hemicentin-2-like isoform X2 [Mya arenaria]